MSREKRLFKRSVDFRPDQIEIIQHLAEDDNRSTNYIIRKALNQYILLNHPDLLPEDLGEEEPELKHMEKLIKKFIKANYQDLIKEEAEKQTMKE
jgi:hypothetical protein